MTAPARLSGRIESPLELQRVGVARGAANKTQEGLCHLIRGGNNGQTRIFGNNGGYGYGRDHESGLCGDRSGLRRNGRSDQGDGAVAFGAAAQFGLSGASTWNPW